MVRRLAVILLTEIRTVYACRRRAHSWDLARRARASIGPRRRTAAYRRSARTTLASCGVLRRRIRKRGRRDDAAVPFAKPSSPMWTFRLVFVTGALFAARR